MNYFITGGTGFIGTHLTKLLKETHPEAIAYNLDIVEPGTPLPAVKRHYRSPLKKGETLPSKFIYCDVRKPIELDVPVSSEDVIFNFAAVHRTPGHPDHEYFETNIRGAENVCAFAERHGIKKIVFTSSIAPYGAAEELKEETTLPTPNTPYGISKLVAEHIHRTWQARDHEHRQLTIVRPGVVFGKGGERQLHPTLLGHPGAQVRLPGQEGHHQGLHLRKGTGAVHALSLGEPWTGSGTVQLLLRARLHHRAHRAGDETSDRTDAIRALHTKRLDHASGLYRPVPGQPDGHLSRQGEETPDLHEHLRQEAGGLGIQVPMDFRGGLGRLVRGQ